MVSARTSSVSTAVPRTNQTATTRPDRASSRCAVHPQSGRTFFGQGERKARRAE